MSHRNPARLGTGFPELGTDDLHESVRRRIAIRVDSFSESDDSQGLLPSSATTQEHDWVWESN